ncbi:MAG: thiopurine S-methyltransferase [Betaproteobacteria bacterium]|nr:thiopurine S-methyltransferase [Betaproteobacteria bacterium]
MTKEYWLDRWEHDEIGFHQNEINPYLRQYWRELNLPSDCKDCQVFVPLCGKSHDLLWLREQGHKVLGVEFSTQAVQAFFDENKLSPQLQTLEKLECLSANDISILCGDFFDVHYHHLSQVGAVYDRASLVALSPEIRKKYVRHLLDILPPATQILLITFDYPQFEMPGPPFAVSAEEVRALYDQHAQIHLLAKFDVTAQNPRYQAYGLSKVQESIYLLTTNPK